MAIAVFGRDDEWFDKVTPRILITMIEEWNKMEKQRAKITGVCVAALMNGKNPDDFLGGKEAEKVSEAKMRKNAKVFF